MDEDIPASAKDAAKVATISTIMIVIIVMGVSVWFVWNKWISPNPPTVTNSYSPSGTPTTTTKPVDTISISPQLSPSNSSPIQTYTSPRLNISFKYSNIAGPETPNNVDTILVEETGDRIYIYPRTSTPEFGQFVEVFKKSSNETLEQAIERLFLVGKNPQQCTIVKGPSMGNMSNISTAEISFPRTNAETPDTLEVKTEYCGKDYAQTNGVRYFLEDKNHPEVFLFISVGQYAIYAEEGIPWQNTIKILN